MEKASIANAARLGKALFFLGVLMVMALAVGVEAQVKNQATLDVFADKTVNRFRPLYVFGNNITVFNDTDPVAEKVEAAGNFFIRYPGGSRADLFHWNGSSAYNGDNHWENSVDYKPGRSVANDLGLYAAARAVDDDRTTAWKSNADTGYPDAQWLQLGFKGLSEMDAITLIWGGAADTTWPRAGKFTVQYWDPGAERQSMVYAADRNGWLNTTAVDVAGIGGIQGVGFEPVKTRYLRVLMKESSGGKRGAYSVFELAAYGSGGKIPLSDSENVAASSTDTASKAGDEGMLSFGEYMEFIDGFSPPGVPLITVNFGTGTPEEAAAWVHYANVFFHDRIKYWEIGNEPNGHWEAGGPLNARDYARRYIRFYEAMKKEDPDITILGPACNFDALSGLYDGASYLEDFIAFLAAQKKVRYAEGISIHHHPADARTADELLAVPSKEMADLETALDTQLKKIPNASRIPIFLTEYTPSRELTPADTPQRLEGGLWLAEYMGEFIRRFGSRGYACMWNILKGGDAAQDPNTGDDGYLQASEGPTQYQERATYWAMRMMTHFWTRHGDDRFHDLVETKCSQESLAAYADHRPDGTLSIMVVNRDPRNAYDTQIRLLGYTPGYEAKVWRFDANNYQWSDAQDPGHADPDTPPSVIRMKRIASQFNVTFTPYSITVVEVDKP